MKAKSFIAVVLSVVVLGGLMSSVARATVTAVPSGSMSATGAGATIVVTGQRSSVDATEFTVSTTDLINQSQATLASANHVNYAGFGDGGTGVLNDGSNGGNNVFPYTGGAFDLDGQWVSTYTLTTSGPSNLLGYTITSVQTLAAGGGRGDQRYELLYSTVAAPSTFISLGTFQLADGTATSLMTITDSTGQIASGVKAIRFNVSVPTAGTTNGTVFREFDVFGVATVLPEPSSMLLCGLGGMLLCRRNRRAA